VLPILAAWILPETAAAAAVSGCQNWAVLVCFYRPDRPYSAAVLAAKGGGIWAVNGLEMDWICLNFVTIWIIGGGTRVYTVSLLVCSVGTLF